MEDDRADPASTGAVVPDAALDARTGGPAVDPALDRAARDQEFELFYQGEMPRLIGFLIIRGAEPALAADISQETMLAAYQRWDDLDAPRAWVRTVALRRWGKLAGRQSREEPAAQVPEPSGLLLPGEADAVAQRHDIVARLAALPEAQREVMAFTFDDYQPNEIAGLLGKNAATVRSLLRQARTALRRNEGASG